MTTLQVHLLMLGLGLLAYLFLAGLFSNRKSYSKRLRRQWWMGALAGIVVAASPLSRFWREAGNGMELLTQSLLVAAISLLALLLFALLRYPLRAIQNSRQNDKSDVVEYSSGVQLHKSSLPNSSTPIAINADGADTVVPAADANAFTPAYKASEVTIDRSMQNTKEKLTPAPAMEPDELTLEPISFGDDAVIDKSADNLHSFTLEADQENTQRLELSDIESVVNMKSERDGSLPLDEKYRQSNAANDNKSTSVPTDADNLDLSETEELFAEMRQQKSTVDLPNEDELRQAKAEATIDELDLDTQLIQEEHISSSDTNQHKTSSEIIEEAEVIEEADVMELDDTSLEFGNDLTGAYAHPVSATSSMNATHASNDSAQSMQVPDTLDDAITAAKATAVSLQAQVSNLEESIVELDDLRDSTIDATIDAANFNAEQQEMQLKQKDALLRSEDEARNAAESVIAAQSALIDRAKRQQAVVNTLLQDERKRMTLLQVEVDRSRKMARTAANLARKAAVAQQEIRNIANREKSARLKSQESTRKAVTIARNAISALAAEERKRGVTRH